MKTLTITDLKGKYPKLVATVEDDANTLTIIADHVVANGWKRYQAGMSMRAYFGRFYVEEKPETKN